MQRLILLSSIVLCAAGAAPDHDDGFASFKKGAPLPTYQLGPKHESLGGIEDFDIVVERWKALPQIKPPEPEHRDLFENDPGARSPLDDRLASTRSGSRDGCHAGSVCYGGAPRLRDSLSDLFGN